MESPTKHRKDREREREEKKEEEELFLREERDPQSSEEVQERLRGLSTHKSQLDILSVRQKLRQSVITHFQRQQNHTTRIKDTVNMR